MPHLTTERTLKHLRSLGFTADKIERHIPMPAGERLNPRTGRKQMSFFLARRYDPFGFDILACHPGGGIHGVQTTNAANHASHRKALLKSERALAWVRSGGRILLISWRKSPKKRGGRQMIWKPRLDWITQGDFDGLDSSPTDPATAHEE